MTYNQIGFRTMGKTNLSFMDLHHLIWGTNNTIMGHYNYIKAEFAEVDAEEAVQRDATTGATAEQNADWMDAADQTTHVCSGIKGYYLNIDDHINYDQVDFSHWNFIKCSKDEALVKMNTVLTHAAAITITLLADYYVTAGEITGLGTAIQKFSDSTPVKKIMTDDVKTATSNIPVHFANIRKRYKKLDPIIEAMKATQADFAKGYKFSREIVNVGKGHKTVELHMMPLQTETAFYNQFEAGDSFVIINPNKQAITVGFATKEHGAPETDTATVPGLSRLVVRISEKAGVLAARYLSVVNTAPLDDAHVTILLAHGVSQSKAGQVELIGHIK